MVTKYEICVDVPEPTVPPAVVIVVVVSWVGFMSVPKCALGEISAKRIRTPAMIAPIFAKVHSMLLVEDYV